MGKGVHNLLCTCIYFTTRSVTSINLVATSLQLALIFQCGGSSPPRTTLLSTKLEQINYYQTSEPDRLRVPFDIRSEASTHSIGMRGGYFYHFPTSHSKNCGAALITLSTRFFFFFTCLLFLFLVGVTLFLFLRAAEKLRHTMRFQLLITISFHLLPPLAKRLQFFSARWKLIDWRWSSGKGRLNFLGFRLGVMFLRRKSSFTTLLPTSQEVTKADDYL